MAAALASLSLAGLLVGVAGGLLVAIGDAFKDSQFEGFLPFKFLRSPVVGGLSAQRRKSLRISGQNSRMVFTRVSEAMDRVPRRTPSPKAV